MDENLPQQLPTADIQPEPERTWFWLIPLAAVLLVAWLGYDSWARRGLEIRVYLENGHGLQAGDDIRYRGIVVGRVKSVELEQTLDGVRLLAVLDPGSQQLARAGTRFWVVRPKVGISGIAGLETIVGPRYLTLLPGEGRPQRSFIGLEEPPILERIRPGDLEIVLQASRRESVRPGTPILYRQVPIGVVLSVGLTSDSSAVEARVHIEKAFTELIRDDTRFWNVGKIEAQLGLQGMTIQMESLETLVAGGIAVATPSAAGQIVSNGHRFRLFDRARDEWLAWEPLIPIGSSLLPPGAIMPVPLRAVLRWQQGTLLTADKSRRGWVLQTADGLVGPRDLFVSDPDAHDDSVQLEISGERLPVPADRVQSRGSLAVLDAHVSRTVWPAARMRRATRPEDCLVIGDPAGRALPLAVSRLTVDEGDWAIDTAVSVDATWHGACVLARSDGQLLGILLVTPDGPRVALLPGEQGGDASEQGK